MQKETSRTLLELITYLNDGEYHDGNSLGAKLGVSRTAIWKMIKKLEAYNIKIESTKGKGYRLEEPLFLLEKKIIQKNIIEKSISLDVFENVDSTNQYLKVYPSKSPIHVCTAEQQSQGRGRLARKWYSPFGQNIYLSLAYRFKKDISELMALSIVTSLAIRETLANYPFPKIPLIKWPNDIYYADQKIAGSLIEIEAESNGYTRAIIGMGINANMCQAGKKEIDQTWTSMQLGLGKPVDRNQLCADLINQLTYYLQQFEQKGDALFIAQWAEYDYLKDHKISLLAYDKKITGIAKGINQFGHLCIAHSDKKIQAYASGDARLLRKIKA